VCAPEDAILQSCAPMPIFPPKSLAGINRDAGGQMTTAGSVSSNAAFIASTSDKLARVPFIFQLPAASLRILFSFGAVHLSSYLSLGIAHSDPRMQESVNDPQN
jgi:hypothetical protein